MLLHNLSSTWPTVRNRVWQPPAVSIDLQNQTVEMFGSLYMSYISYKYYSFTALLGYMGHRRSRMREACMALGYVMVLRDQRLNAAKSPPFFWLGRSDSDC